MWPAIVEQIMSVFSVDKLISQARQLASDYRRATGKSLGISTEIAEHDACQLLNLELCPQPRDAGYDAVGKGVRDGRRIQIKGRVIFDESRNDQRIGQLKIEKEWDSVVLVLMDEAYEPYEVYEAMRADIEDVWNRASASKRAKRGAMSVARFKNISQLVWTRENGPEDEVWDNKASV